MNQSAKSSDPAKTPVPATPRRRWWRWIVLLAVVAVALVAGRSYLQGRAWLAFQQEVNSAGGGAALEYVESQEFVQEWGLDWLPTWMLRRFPFGRKYFHLLLSGDWVDDRWLLEHQEQLRTLGLTSLDLDGRVSDAGLRVLGNHPTLEHLNLRRNHLSPNCLLEMGELPSLRILWVAEVSLSPASVRHMDDWPKLSALDFNAASPGLSELAALKKLQAITLQRTDDESLQRFPIGCAVEDLVLPESRITNASIPRLLQLKHVQNLSFDSPLFSKEDLLNLQAAHFVVNYLPPPNNGPARQTN